MDPFLTILNKAHEVVTQFYPNAELLDFTRDLKLLDTPWMFTFRTAEGTAVLKYIDGKGFITPPEPHPTKLGIRTIPMLISLAEAQKKISFVPEFVQLYWALYPGIDQPYFAFHTENKIAFVGAFDGKINPNLVNLETLATGVALTPILPVATR